MKPLVAFCIRKPMPLFKKFLPFLSPLLLFICAIYPNITYCILHDEGISYLITSVLYALPLLPILLVIRKRWLYILLAILITCSTLLEYTMVVLFDNYVLSGNILAIIMTDTAEGSDFIKANAYVCWQWIPIIIISVLSCYTYSEKTICKLLCVIGLFVVLVALPCSFVCYKLSYTYSGKDKLTYQYFIQTRILNRPPYNIPYQLYNIAKIQSVKKYIEEAKSFTFNATKSPSSIREIHVLAIGESMRYSNLSLNGYVRKTTPNLDTIANLISYDNYYSTACLTMFSVPQIVTRATPQNYERNYKERGIVQAFKEVGFKTYVLVGGRNLLSYEKYLTNSADSLILLPDRIKNGEVISGDRDIAFKMDSLIASTDENLFFVLQFKGNHHPYTNYENEFDRWIPNFKTSGSAEISDSLYINAYDNSMLYQDYILSDIISKIDKSNTIATFTLVSDHGENLTATGGGHGGNCNPIRTEYHVPFLFWYSNDFVNSFPKKIENAKSNESAKINADNIFYTVCDIANIQIDSTYQQNEYSLVSDSFKEHERYVLLPDGVSYIKVD